MQTLDDTILPQLGRGHDAPAARDAFEAARAAGFDNVSVDLMYGLPGLDLDGWERAVETVLDWGPITFRPTASRSTREASGAPPASEACRPRTRWSEQYWALARAAAARGFEHYEISNYARPGFRSRHNQIYWRAAEYLAAGPGACGFVGRTCATRNVKPVAR